MAKMYKKDKLSMVDGMIVNKKGDIVVPDREIVNLANTLDTLLQKACYLMGQPEAQEGPSLDGFVRKSIKTDPGRFKPRTPVLDAKAKEALDLMDELDSVTTTTQMNGMLEEWAKLIEFADCDYVIDCDIWRGDVFDTPYLCSNILELTRETIIQAIGIINGYEVNVNDDGSYTLTEL